MNEKTLRWCGLEICKTREKSNVASEMGREEKIVKPQKKVEARSWILVRIVNLF